MIENEMENLPEVSVICIAYNQEKVISRCLDGFVNQKTDFKYEVIVHDDCSTDGTLDVILSYEKKYPDLFVVITEEENQFLKAANFDDIIMPYVRGRYIAVCEGDDYWCNQMKLQKQYDFMGVHPECSLVCHNTIINDLGSNGPLQMFNDWKDIHCLTEEEVFLDWKVHTSSYFFRKECYRVRDEYSYWCRFFSDYIRLCNAKDLGEVYCLPELMSVYDFNNPEGVTNVYNKDFKKKLNQLEGQITFLKEFDEFTDHRHSEVILKRLNYQIEEMNKIMKKM